MLLHGRLGAPLFLSSIVAIEISILTNFALNHTWTWRLSLRTPGLMRRALQYHAAAVMAAGPRVVAVPSPETGRTAAASDSGLPVQNR